MARTKTLTAVPDLHDDPRVKAEYEKLNQLTRRRDKIEIELEGMRGQNPRQRVQDEAAAMIAGKPAPTKEDKPVRADLLHTLNVIAEAEKIQRAAIDRVQSEVSRESRERLTARRHEHLLQLNGAVEDMIEALRALTEFHDECERTGVTEHYGIGVPWTGAAIELGEPRWIVERLEAWRAEFQKTKFQIS